MAGHDLVLGIKINADGTAAVTTINHVGDSVDNLGNRAQNAQRDVGGLEKSIKDLVSAGTALAAAEKFIEYNRALESIQGALLQLTGSQQAADATLSRIADTADRLGQSVLGLAGQYIQLAAATKNTALEGVATDAVFNSIVGTMGKLGKSSAETSRALAAVAQMASKGVVSAEEMRGQLGEALPGAMQALASATAIPVVELNKMMEAGTLMATDVLPALAKGLDDTFGSDAVARVETLGASVERMKNTIAGAFTALGEAGVSKGLASAMDKIGYAIRGVTAGSVSLVQQVAITAAALTDSSSTWETYADAIAENTAEWEAYVEGGTKAEQATKANADATQAAAIAALKSASAYTEASKSAADNVLLAKKQADATDAAAASSERWVKVLGTEKEQLETLVRATAERLVSMQREAAEKQKQQSVDLARIAQMRAEIEQSKVIGEAEGKTAEQIAEGLSVRVKQIEVLEKNTDARQAEIDKLGKEIDSQRAAQVAGQLAVKTYGDQSDKLAELISERERLTRVNDAAAQKVDALKAANVLLLRQQQELQQAQQDGLAVTAELDETTRQLSESVSAIALAEREAKASAQELAESQKLVIDALRDTQERLKAESAALADQVKASNDLIEIKGIELQRRKAVAEAMGDEQAAASLNIQSLRLELQEINNNAEGLRTRADLALKAAAARKEELEASGKYQGALKSETEAQIRAAEAMQVEADKLDAVAKAKQTEISLAAQLIDAQNAVNAVVAEYAALNQEAADAAQEAGDAAIAAGQNQYEAAETARQAAEDSVSAAQQSAKAAAESVVWTSQLSAALTSLYDKYDSLGDSAYRAWLKSADALKQMSTAWQSGTIDTELASVEEHLQDIGIAQANLDSLISKLQSGAFTANDLTQAEREASAGARQLGEERLQILRDSIENAKQRVIDLKNETADALKSWQDKLDELSGNDLAIAERQRITDLADLQDKLNAAVAAGNAEAAANLREAISTAEQYWTKYIAGLKAADDAAKSSNLPGITDNGDGVISSTLPTTNEGGGATGGGISSRLGATIASADIETLTDSLGKTVTSAMDTLARSIKEQTITVSVDGRALSDVVSQYQLKAQQRAA